MESDPGPDPYSTPKLPLFSFPQHLPEPSGISTPPLQTAASVPFRWEEHPGKPRPCTDLIISGKTPPRRRLDLPPRLAMVELESNVSLEVKGSNSTVDRSGGAVKKKTSSPTTVLDGPGTGDVGPKSLFSSFSLRFPGERRRRLGSFDSNCSGGWSPVGGSNDGGDGGGWREVVVGDGSLRRNGGGGRLFGSFRLKRNANESKVSGRSKFLAKIYEGFKQAVPWRTKRERESFTL